MKSKGRSGADRPPLTLYSTQKLYRISKDYSSKRIGVTLEQMESNEWHLVTCCARKCSYAESRYTSTKGELLTLVWGLERLACIIWGKRTVVRTDARALVWGLKTATQSDAMIYRLLPKLTQYNISLTHVEGRRNELADYLSRSPKKAGPVTVVPTIQGVISITPEKAEKISDQDLLDTWWFVSTAQDTGFALYHVPRVYQEMIGQ
eukprot:Lankesteria_metandrocarpae@DN3779_c0_g1_i1.p1